MAPKPVALHKNGNAEFVLKESQAVSLLTKAATSGKTIGIDFFATLPTKRSGHGRVHGGASIAVGFETAVKFIRDVLTDAGQSGLVRLEVGPRHVEICLV